MNIIRKFTRPVKGCPGRGNDRLRAPEGHSGEDITDVNKL